MRLDFVLPVEVVHVHDPRVVRGRGHVDDPGAGAGPPGPLQEVQQQVGEQEVAQVVEHKVELEALLGAPLGNQHGPGWGSHRDTVQIKPRLFFFFFLIVFNQGRE